jgi:alkylation response protein AidB-like acyl-CoA dehydrogenase
MATRGELGGDGDRSVRGVGRHRALRGGERRDPRACERRARAGRPQHRTLRASHRRPPTTGATINTTITPPIPSAASALTDETLQRFRERADELDASNRFLDDDFAELGDSGYLRSPLPAARSGRGLDLAQMATEQRRLARFAPATALATSMHLYWAGAATDLERLGYPGVGWIVDEIADGEIFASGHAEAGNDVPVLLSSTPASRVDGGYRITGRKHFTSLSPV